MYCDSIEQNRCVPVSGEAVRSGLNLRQPLVPIEGRYWVTVGADETYGRFLDMPYPALVEQITGVPVVNLGCPHAGIGAIMNDRSCMGMCRGASVVVIKLEDIRSQSNDYYSVHPRRNDRLTAIHTPLRRAFPDVDFTQFTFTGHLFRELARHDNDRLLQVAAELRGNWCRQMERFLSALPGHKVLLWFADTPPLPDGTSETGVTRSMIDHIRQFADDMVTVIAGPEEIAAGARRMANAPEQKAMAAEFMGELAHEKAARHICHALDGFR